MDEYHFNFQSFVDLIFEIVDRNLANQPHTQEWALDQNEGDGSDDDPSFIYFMSRFKPVKWVVDIFLSHLRPENVTF